MALPFRLKKPKLRSLVKEVKIPAIEELKESRKRLRRDRNDLFTIYGELFIALSFRFFVWLQNSLRFCVEREGVVCGALEIWETRK